MGVWTQLGRRKNALGALKRVLEHPENVVLVHYSCESFYERPNGASPRITSIAVRVLSSAQTSSFSIHQVAERQGVALAELEVTYDRLERIMLDEFYHFLRGHSTFLLVHWNMRDVNFGFPALAHRYRVLGGDPPPVHDSQLVDLARILRGIYGEKYVGHPKLETLVDRNGLTKVGFLSGRAEAEAFEKREYVRLHQSTLRKVHIFESLLARIEGRTLTTDATFRDKYGGYLGTLVGLSTEHPLGALLTLAGTVCSILGVITLFR